MTFIAEFEYGGALFYNVMLVEGDKATDYTPSFIDINNSIAKMEIKADEIASTVAKQEVKNMKLGGANLLLNSDEKKELNRAEPLYVYIFIYSFSYSFP